MSFLKNLKTESERITFVFCFFFHSSRLLWIIWIRTCCQCSLIKSNWTMAPFTSHQHSVHVYAYVLCSYLEVLSHNWLPLGVGQSGIVRCFRKCHLCPSWLPVRFSMWLHDPQVIGLNAHPIESPSLKHSIPIKLAPFNSNFNLMEVPLYPEGPVIRNESM